jgi:uncharacterized glyoxalase superfamily protein PhnB
MNELIPLLNVENVSTSIDFYAKALDATVENQWEAAGVVRWARIRFNGSRLMLNAPERIASAERRRRGDFTDVVLYVMCESAAKYRAKLLAAGLPAGELSHEEYGNDEFALRDPDGYAIRFASPRM